MNDSENFDLNDYRFDEVDNKTDMHGFEEYLEKFHSDLGLPAPILGDVRALWNRVHDQYAWQGKKPSGIAGVLLYHASQKSGSPRTQSEVCRVSGISEVTLRGLLKQLNSMLESK